MDNEIKYRLEENSSQVKIFINDVMHLLINKKKLVGIQSWKYGHEEYVIEISYDTCNTCCSYDTKEKWENVLKLISESLYQ